MRAAITTDDGRFDVVTAPDPTPADDELVIEVAACGVCGSDLKARPFMPPGTVMGHELGGTVVAVGTAARRSGWTEGVNVAVLPVVSCGHCSWCQSGHVAHCPEVRFIGMGPGLHAMHTAAIDPGSDVLVVGAGGVGLTAIAWAHDLGAARVTAVDPDSARRAAAVAVGADDALSSLEDADAGGYDAVIECVGRPELIAGAAGAARARGRIVIAGACDQPVSVDPIAALLGELSFRWSLAYQPEEFRTVIDAFASGRIDPAAVIGATLGLEHVDDTFENVRTAVGSGRVLVTPWLR